MYSERKIKKEGIIDCVGDISCRRLPQSLSQYTEQGWLLFVWKNALAVPSLLAWELGFGNALAYPLASCTIGCDSMAVTAAVPRHVAAAATTMANMVIVFLLIISVDVM
jgi:hypothetical protein